MFARPAFASVALGSVLLATGAGCGSEAEASPFEPATRDVASEDATSPGEAAPSDDGALHYDPRQSLAPLVDSVAPSVVSIRASGRGRGFFSAGTEGSGSGFVYASDGIVVTNHHVVDGADRIQVRMHDGTRYDARVLGSDAATDLAVLELEGARDLPALQLGDSSELRVGDWVVAIGNPMGLDHSASVGILSGRGRGSLGLYGADSYLDFLQTDADIAPGSSGGPLFDLRGAVVGITTAVGANSRPGFAIPASQAQPVIEQLRATGSVRRGWLGAASERDAQEGRGAVIGEVYADTPAAEAGLRAGDVITRVDRTNVDDFDGLRGIIATLAPGHTVLLEVERDGETLELTAVLGDRANQGDLKRLRPAAPTFEAPPAAPTEGFGERLGIGARAHDDGLEVVRVEPGSLAEDLDLQAGDVITELNGVSVRAPEDVRDALTRSRGKIEVSLMRAGVKHNVTLERS